MALNILGRMLRRITGADEPGRFNVLDGRRPVAGINVTQQSALAFVPVFACIRAISETISTLPSSLNEHLPDGGSKRLDDHPLAIAMRFPNDEMTGVTLWKTIEAWVDSWGNGYAEIVRNNAGHTTGFWPIPPDRVTPERDGTKLVYVVRSTDGRQEVVLPASSMLHAKGLGYDGLVGYSPITMAREAISLGLAAESFGGAFYGNGAYPGGLIEVPEGLKLDQEGLKNLKAAWNSAHGGSRRSFRTGVLDGGMTWKSTTVSPEDAQFIELRAFQGKEIARMWRIPPHKIGILDEATFSNIEAQNNEFAVDTILPRVVNLEAEINCKCLLPSEVGHLFVRFNMDGLLRGDVTAQSAAFATGRQWGWLSVNDIRRLLKMKPIENGDIYLEPANMTEAGAEPDEPESPPVGFDREQAARAAGRVFTDAVGIVLTKEVKAVTRAAGKHNGEFDAWADKFYGGHRHWVKERLMPAAMCLTELVCGEPATESLTSSIEAFVDICAGHWVEDGLNMLKATHAAGGSVVEVIGQWQEHRLPKCVDFMTEQTVNAVMLNMGASHGNNANYTD